MTTYDVITKLIGSINPVGQTEVDEIRFKNLLVMTSTVELLIRDIDAVAYDNRNSKEFSVKRSANFASKFLKDDLGIKNCSCENT